MRNKIQACEGIIGLLLYMSERLKHKNQIDGHKPEFSFLPKNYFPFLHTVGIYTRGTTTQINK